MYNKFIKFSLDQVGPGFCLAKWTNSTMHLGMGKTHSCHHPVPQLIPVEEITADPSALHNSSYKKSIRNEMLNGQRPSECNYCWKIEDNNTISDRVLMSAKSDSIFHFNKIKQTNEYDPTYLEVSFSNSCNFACAYCGPAFSSKWSKEIQLHGGYPTSNYNAYIENNISDTEQNPYIEAFWKYLPVIYKGLQTLRITGGEPMMSKHTDILLEYIANNSNKHMTLVINTNLGVSDRKFLDFLARLSKVEQNVKRIDIATSCESYGNKAEYVRDGLNFEKWYNNCVYILENFPKVNLQLMCAYNVFSITSFTEFLKIIKNLQTKYKRVYLSITYVCDPSFMSIAVAPKEWISYLQESKNFINKNFTKETEQRFEHVIAFFNDSVQNKQELIHLSHFITEYDKRRNKNFISIFPEYNFIFEN